MELFWKIHPKLYRWSGGRILGSVLGMPVLLLTTTGRKSGLPRTKALMYLPRGDDLGRSKKLNPDSCGNRRDGHKPFFKAAESLEALFELSHGLQRKFHAGFVDALNVGDDRLL